ncbi:MAG: hypothetical protein M1825_002233 [Sarcosagium campestre]|nr:MAG: hypothetical protein M1825_002233 [Sarcosagium campestre]
MDSYSPGPDLFRRQDAATQFNSQSGLSPADCSKSGADQFLCLLANPFSSVLQANAFWVSLGTSIGFTVLIALLFSLLRPHNNTVYAPKLKHADERHAPPAMGKGFFAWTTPLLKTREMHLVDKIGLDATIFLRFMRMCRNLFLVMSFIGCAVLIPANVIGSDPNLKAGLKGFTLMTPLIVKPQALWAQVVCSWLFDVIVAVFLWINYRAVVKLVRANFCSPEYQASLHARTLMITHIPNAHRSDHGLGSITEEPKVLTSTPYCAIGRNVQGLPKLIKQHEAAVRQLESVLAVYLKNPNSLPASRPECRPFSDDKSFPNRQRLDAIEYLTDRISVLEYEIKDARSRVDARNPMNYGFASYDSVTEAHAVAFAARKSHPKGATLRLAPTPKEIVWDNLAMTKKARRWKGFTNGLWVSLLTVVYIAPNAMIAIFLTNLSNLGLVWPAFQTQLYKHPVWWAAVQGVASPALTSLVYLLLPIVFRRLANAEKTKTAREQHVTHQLYAFFVFNNLIVFTLFSAIWQYVATVRFLSEKQGKDTWTAIKEGHLGVNIANSLCLVSPFWVTWILQRNLGAAVDLSQIFNLIWTSFAKKFMNPTARQLIEWTAPPNFDYASYYNYFLFYASIALCFATLQPLVLLATALYFVLDSWLKKYLLMYVFVTKTESGGQSWRILYNRLVFAAIGANIIVALLVYAKDQNVMAIAMIPPPILMIGFKIYCHRAFDDRIKYYTKGLPRDMEPLDAGANPKGMGGKTARVVVKFAHPAMHQKLLTPMVRENARPLLEQVYRGRLNPDADDGAAATTGWAGYDQINLDHMSSSRPGKAKGGAAPQWEVVPENHLDFTYFKNRAEFGDEHGSGDIYGAAASDTTSMRSGTPMSFMHQQGYTTSPPPSRGVTPVGGGRPAVYGNTSPVYRDRSPGPGFNNGPANIYTDGAPAAAATASSPYLRRTDSESGLLRGAQGMPVGQQVPAAAAAAANDSRDHSLDRYNADGSVYYGRGYAGVPQQPVDDPLSYDYFRGRR